MKKLELLAPAKNLECGIAAIDHGADAVYIGAPRFGARAAAGNSLDDIASLCAYAHQFAAKVYVTVNTLLRDDELDEAGRLLVQLDQCGIDAVLVQDFRLLSLAASLPQRLHYPFHASTQTDNRTVEQVLTLRRLGFRRVVLARELSLSEIAAIHQAVPDVELEVFVHGALCVSYSGVCFASEHCFGRSANRGECAQFCRMPFDLVDADGREWQHQRHLLSLKDLNQSRHLDALIDAGAVSFKIEGRLKDVAYVKNVTAFYSQLLDTYVSCHSGECARASIGRCTYTFRPDIEKTFNRGYTTYFLQGRQPDIACFDTPKAIGEYVGTVKELRGTSFTVAGTASFANGDGLCFFRTLAAGERQLEGFRVNRAEGNRLFPQHLPNGLRPGMRLYRNHDIAFERMLSGRTAVRTIPLQIQFSAVDGGFRLDASAGLRSCSLFFPLEHQPARLPQRDNVVRQLTRLGGTPFSCVEVLMDAEFSLFVPSSLLSQWRRSMVESLLSAAEPVSEVDASVPAVLPPLPPKSPLMQCRHCLRYALGFCVKHGGRRPQWREPVSLRLSDGRTFPLEFDCKNCQMNVYAS